MIPSDTKKSPAELPQIVADPNNVPVLHITGAVSNMQNGQTIAVNLVTDRMTVQMNGQAIPDIIIAARLRFDLSTARIIRDQIDAHLSVLSAKPPSGRKPN